MDYYKIMTRSRKFKKFTLISLRFIRQYNNTLAVANAYSQKTIEKLESEANKFRDFLNEKS